MNEIEIPLMLIPITVGIVILGIMFISPDINRNTPYINYTETHCESLNGTHYIGFAGDGHGGPQCIIPPSTIEKCFGVKPHKSIILHYQYINETEVREGIKNEC